MWFLCVSITTTFSLSTSLTKERRKLIGRITVCYGEIFITPNGFQQPYSRQNATIPTNVVDSARVVGHRKLATAQDFIQTANDKARKAVARFENIVKTNDDWKNLGV